MIRTVFALSVISATILLNIPQAFATTSWWAEPGMIVEADEAVTPKNFSSNSPDAYEPDNTSETAVY
ncbi:MAG: hypothetical protein HY779_00435, partial [Rubrobacteridae bacterium]|nr:hypothetical protein [Rubrobacteridae bacterium]